jgi:hypothetical protein
MGPVVKIVLSEPIRPSSSGTGALLVVGILLLLYPLAWILLLQHSEGGDDSSSVATVPRGIQRRVMDDLAYLILDLTPLIANAGFALFLAAFFFCIGSLKRQRKMA